MMSFKPAGLLVLISAGALTLAACGGDDASGSGDDVSGVVWMLTELDGEAVPDGVAATLQYDGTSISGSTGCNTYGGDATFDDGTVTISSQIMSTLIACEPPIGDVEATFLQTLPNVTEFEVDADTLTLSADGDAVMVFTESSAAG